MLDGARNIFAASMPSDTGHLRPSKRKLVDVFVSKDQLERALEFLDTLFKALEGRGHRVALPLREDTFGGSRSTSARLRSASTTGLATGARTGRP